MDKNMIFDVKAGRGTNQIMLEGDIVIPDNKPDIGYIIWKDTAIHIDNTDIVNERVNYKGSLDMNILYMEKNEASCQSVRASVPINDFINIENIDSSMIVSISSETADIRYRTVNERKINYRIVSDVSAQVTKKEENTVITDMEDIPESQKIINTMEIDRIITSLNDTFAVKDRLAIPNGRPDISQIIFSDAGIISSEVLAESGRISVRGILKTSYLYNSFEENMPEYVENEIPFNGDIDSPETAQGMDVDCKLSVRSINITPAEDDNGEMREVEIDCTAGCDAKITERITENILEDVYCINKKTNMKKNCINYSDLLCRNRNSCVIRQRIKLEDSSPDILQIIKAGGNIHIDDFAAAENKINAEGIINVQIMYTAKNDRKPIFCIDAVVPFSQGIEAVGVTPEGKFDVVMNSQVENVNINILSNREIDVSCAININVSVFNDKCRNIISGIEFEDMQCDELNKIAAMTVYVVKKGDTLWNIAKKYNTSVDEILKVNDIENPDLIYPKQKLLILKGFCA